MRVKIGNANIEIWDEDKYWLGLPEINIDDDVYNWESTLAKYPYYRLRGKPVTKKQAFDIIRRTDSIFESDIKLPKCSDYVGTCHLKNVWFQRNMGGGYHGWVHADGAIGGNGITVKYPNLEEVLNELIDYVWHFPYLDFVLAVTDWNEHPYEFWDYFNSDDERIRNRYLRMEEKEEFSGFYDAIVIGFWVHDGKIDVLNGKKASKKYKEYEKLYAKKPDIYYTRSYWADNDLEPCGIEYLKKCIEVYGLDAEETLSKIPRYILYANG